MKPRRFEHDSRMAISALVSLLLFIFSMSVAPIASSRLLGSSPSLDLSHPSSTPMQTLISRLGRLLFGDDIDEFDYAPAYDSYSESVGAMNVSSTDIEQANITSLSLMSNSSRSSPLKTGLNSTDNNNMTIIRNSSNHHGANASSANSSLTQSRTNQSSSLFPAVNNKLHSANASALNITLYVSALNATLLPSANASALNASVLTTNISAINVTLPRSANASALNATVSSATSNASAINVTLHTSNVSAINATLHSYNNLDHGNASRHTNVSSLVASHASINNTAGGLSAVTVKDSNHSVTSLNKTDLANLLLINGSLPSLINGSLMHSTTNIPFQPPPTVQTSPPLDPPSSPSGVPQAQQQIVATSSDQRHDPDDDQQQQPAGGSGPRAGRLRRRRPPGHRSGQQLPHQQGQGSFDAHAADQVPNSSQTSKEEEHAEEKVHQPETNGLLRSTDMSQDTGSNPTPPSALPPTILPPPLAGGAVESALETPFVDVEVDWITWDEIYGIKMRDIYWGVAGTVALAVLILGGVIGGRKLLSFVKLESSPVADQAPKRYLL